jgi:hypothetical protein
MRSKSTADCRRGAEHVRVEDWYKRKNREAIVKCEIKKNKNPPVN